MKRTVIREMCDFQKGRNLGCEVFYICSVIPLIIRFVEKVYMVLITLEIASKTALLFHTVRTAGPEQYIGLRRP